MDPLTRLAAGIAQARPVIAATPRDAYQNATPCPPWTAGELINHMLVGLAIFRDVANHGEVDPELFGRNLIGDDATASFDAIGEETLAAWRSGDRLQGMAKLPFGEFPAQFALQFPAMDMLVHSWDLAQATGQQVDWDEHLVAEVLDFSHQLLPEGQERGHDFGAPVPVADAASPMDQLVAFLGREPLGA